jgi:surfactin synthase thioesterase subunit
MQPTLSQPARPAPPVVRPAKATSLNGHLPSRRNFYVLSYSPGEIEFMDDELTDNFNFIHLYFDIHNSCKVPGGAQLIMKQLAGILRNDKQAIVLGHSCNGYVAHQLAAILPQISHCVIVDAFNEFLHDEYVRKNPIRSLATNLYRQMIQNRDPGYLMSLARHFLRNLRKPKIAYDYGVREGAECFYHTVRNSPCINDCIFFRATRSTMSNPRHGWNWRPYVGGKFHLLPIRADHVAIKEHRKEIAAHIVRIVLHKSEVYYLERPLEPEIRLATAPEK